MKRWTFAQQTGWCFLLIVLASVAAALLQLGILGRLAFLLVGLAYLLHPVAPVSMQIQWGDRAKWFSRLLGVSFILYGLAAQF